jgi:hypothetical protein
MTKVKLLLLSMLAVFAVSAVASATASAEMELCKTKEGADFVLCVEKPAGSGLLLVETSVAFVSRKTPGTASALEIPAIPAKITCEKAANTGQFDTPEEPRGVQILKLTISFTGCTEAEEGSTICTVAEPITTAAINGVFTLVGGTTTVEFAPTTGTEFSTIRVNSKSGHTCTSAASSPLKVSGTQTCTAPNIENTDYITHLLQCAGSGSKLKAAGHEAVFTLEEEVELAAPSEFTGIPWDIIEGL